MANVKQVELKPCPFCGGEQLEICRTDYTPDNCKAYAVTCRTRGCHGAIFQLGYGLFDTATEAITAWNARPALATAEPIIRADAVAAEREACAKVADDAINADCSDPGCLQCQTARVIARAIRGRP